MRVIVKKAAEGRDQISRIEVDGVAYLRSEAEGRVGWVSEAGDAISKYDLATALEQFGATDDADRDPAVEIVRE